MTQCLEAEQFFDNYVQAWGAFYAAQGERGPVGSSPEESRVLNNARQMYWQHVRLHGCRDAANTKPIQEVGYPRRASF